MQLEVLLDQNLVGKLSHDALTNRFSFAYDPVWVANDAATPLSPALPFVLTPNVTADTHSATVRQFFENLLPEGQALDDAAAAYKVSKANVTGLLVALGRETAGAISLRLADSNDPESTVRRPLPLEELSERIRQRPQLPFTVWDGKVRISIAGYQDKLAVYEENALWYLVEGRDLASTHILKPEPANPGMAGLTFNEFFCMRLAEAIKLPAASARLYHVPEPVLSITRFDRRREGLNVRRLHAIDGCQLLGLSSSFKYERPYGDSRDVRDIRDGASLPRLFAALQTSPSPAAQQLRLLRWAIFQVIIGNTDAHAKNLTFLIGPGGATLAPAYDLVCGRIFSNTHLDQTFAMAIGDAFATEDLSPYEWAVMCVQARLNPRQVRKELVGMAKAVLSALPLVARISVEEGADSAGIAKLVALIAEECDRQQSMAAGIVGMMSAAS